jgi:hypothetical protein
MARGSPAGPTPDRMEGLSTTLLHGGPGIIDRSSGPERPAGARVHAGGAVGPEEYRQVVAYHYRMARHHLFKAQTYRDHAKARFGVQLLLFDEDDGEMGTP